MNLKKFINKTLPHGKNNSAPPKDPFKRHEWESKLLYSVKDVLSDRCKIIDYGCGGEATLRYTLRNHHPNSTYYGLDINTDIGDNKGFNKLNDENNTKFYDINMLDEILPEVDGMVLGSVFTHLHIDKINDILHKTLSHYDRGFQMGFSAFIDNRVWHYHPDPKIEEYFWAVTLSMDYLSDFCDRNNLKLIINPYIYKLDHVVEIEDTCIKYHNFITIKK